MSEHDPFERLGELIDQPVAPEARFAADLKAQLMSGLTASERLREEEHDNVEIVLHQPGHIVAWPEQKKKRIKPMVVLEIAAVLALLVGIGAVLYSNRLGSDPGNETAVPAALLQEDASPTSTPGAAPTVVPPTAAPDTMPEPAHELPVSGAEPTIVPPVAPAYGALWTVSLPEGESLDYGGMASYGNTLYRMLATPSFVGIEAIDATSGATLWKQHADWSNWSIAADEHGVYYYASAASENRAGRLNALDANGEFRWRVDLPADPRSLNVVDGVLYVADIAGTTTAIDTFDGSQLWAYTDSSTAAGAQPYSIFLRDSGIPVVISDAVATLNGKGEVVLLDRQTGEVRWSVPGFYSLATSLTAAGDRLIVSSAIWEDGSTATPVAGPDTTSSVDSVVLQVVELDLNDGSQVWETHVATPLVQPVATGSLVVFTGMPVEMESGEPSQRISRDELASQLTGVDATSGEILWTTAAAEGDVIVKAGTDAGVIATGSPGVFLVSDADDLHQLSAKGSLGSITDVEVVGYFVVASLADGTLAGFPLESE